MNADEVIYWILLIPLGIFTCVAIYNYFTAPRLGNNVSVNKKNPFVSILIPARNEGKNIKNCIRSILDQSYKNYEVIVLNDNSEDNTAEIVINMKEENVTLVNGTPLPEGWFGKNWACHQLSQKAKGEILLFIDADVIIKEHAVEAAVNELLISESDMISVFPTQIISTLGEQLVVPLMNWLLLNFLPLRFVYSSKKKSFAAANGQFILIKKNVYEIIGGHSFLRNKVVEDMEMARELKKRNYKIKTLLGNNLIFCRMYNDFTSSVKGFSKNFYKGFNIPYLFFFLFVLFIEIIYLVPIILLFASFQFAVLVLLILISRIFISSTSNQNIFASLFLHPLQMIILLFVGINSVYIDFYKGIEWKGRIIK